MYSSSRSREALSLWCCKLHNEVNAKLGLPEFECSLKELDRRWKTGSPECWNNQSNPIN